MARGWTPGTLAPLAGASSMEAWTGEGSWHGGGKRGREGEGLLAGSVTGIIVPLHM